LKSMSVAELKQASAAAHPAPAHADLPADPALDHAEFTLESVDTPDAGRIEVMRPARAEFRSAPEHAPIVICVPGLGMDANSFVRQLPLGARAHLHCLRYPAQSVKGEARLSHFARYVEAYVHARNLHQHPGGVVLLGTSMGGAVSQTVALRKRINLRGLVLVGTFGSARHVAGWQRLFAPAAWVIPFKWIIHGLLKPSFLMRTKGFGRYGDVDAKFMAQAVRIPSNYSFARAAMGLTRLNLVPQLRELKVPTLIVHGTDDRVLPHAAAVELAQAIPGSQLVTLRDASHSLFFLNHREVNHAVAAYLAELA